MQNAVFFTSSPLQVHFYGPPTRCRHNGPKSVHSGQRKQVDRCPGSLTPEELFCPTHPLLPAPEGLSFGFCFSVMIFSLLSRTRLSYSVVTGIAQTRVCTPSAPEPGFWALCLTSGPESLACHLWYCLLSLEFERISVEGLRPRIIFCFGSPEPKVKCTCKPWACCPASALFGCAL